VAMFKKNYKFKRLFEPRFLWTLKVKNRLIMPAMGTRLAIEYDYVGTKQDIFSVFPKWIR
jgi:2,4-dienoyl-CoA reductase-like NADH-dependent reductase (Old Yellow Enzyme family)